MENLDTLKNQLEAAQSEFINKEKTNLHKAGTFTLSGTAIQPVLTTTAQSALNLQADFTLPGFLKGQCTIHLKSHTLTIPQENLLNEFSGNIMGPGRVVKNGRVIRLGEGEQFGMIDGDLKLVAQNSAARDLRP